MAIEFTEDDNWVSELYHGRFEACGTREEVASDLGWGAVSCQTLVLSLLGC